MVGRVLTNSSIVVYRQFVACHMTSLLVLTDCYAKHSDSLSACFAR